jgi:hypothetical protein
VASPDPKPPRAYHASRTRYAQLREEAYAQTLGFCFCGCGRAADSTHHLIGGISEREDVIENLVPLAGDGTRLCHGAMTTAQTTTDALGNRILPGVVRAGIRRNLEEFPEKRAYVVARKGEEWLERHYPSSRSAASR